MPSKPGKRGPKPSAGPAAVPLSGAPKPPAFLGAEGKRHWREVCQLVAEAGFLSQLDRDCLSAYCDLWEKWRAAEAEWAKPDRVDESGATIPDSSGPVITTPNGYRQVNPWYTLAIAHLAAMKPYLDMLGLSPKARSKLRLPEREEKDTRWDESEDE